VENPSLRLRKITRYDMAFTDMDSIIEQPSTGKLFSLGGCITGNPAMAILYDENNNRFDDEATWEDACSWDCIYAPNTADPCEKPEDEDTAEKALARHYAHRDGGLTFEEPVFEDHWEGR
jgi:hypothetical protein